MAEKVSRRYPEWLLQWSQLAVVVIAVPGGVACLMSCWCEWTLQRRRWNMSWIDEFE